MSRELDLLAEDLFGVHLVEAGAGSGKTYAIAALYVRLVVERELPPEAILVTTFTDAAAGELRDRIRLKLRSAKEWLERGGPPQGENPDAFLSGLAARIRDPETAIRQIAGALRDFDQAAIHTIHAFCLRTLQDYAFESGASFDAELSKDQAGLVNAVLRDFWREKVYGADAAFLDYLATQKVDLAKLRPLAQARLNHPEAVLDPPHVAAWDQDLENSARMRIQSAFAEVAALWDAPGVQGEVRRLLGSDDASKSYYRQDKLDALCAAMDGLLAAGWADALALFPNFKCFTPEFLVPGKGLKKAAEPVRHPFFHACGALQDALQELEQGFAARLALLKHELARSLPERLALRKRAENVLCFDDLVGDMDAALRGPGGKRMRQELRARCRAALIDEFQDTDPRQYRIFHTLFGRDPGGETGEETHALFLIGDPKQAIYGFRGADVFAYLRAKKDVAEPSTLTHNWRSEPGLVRGVNALFTARPDPFLLQGMAFEPARPAKRDMGLLAEDPALGGEPGGQLRVWRLDSEARTKGDLEKRLHQAVADEVVRLLNLAARGGATLGSRALAPGDMAVLVQSHFQAAAVRQLLEARNVPCVISKCGNVFRVRQAGELLRILQALAEPDESSVLSALVTDVLGVKPLDALALREDAHRLDAWLDLFAECREAWQRGGVMAAAGRLLAAARVRPRLLAQDQGERKLTDLLHLLELVHAREQETRFGPAEIVAWLAASMIDSGDGETPEEHQLRLDKDADAVKVVTIHASKGLEYPVVFAPYVLFGRRVSPDPGLYHDPGRDMAMVLDPSPEAEGPGRALQEREALAESLRLAYVALTRACNRCYTAWGALNPSAKAALVSAMQYLLNPEVLAEGDAYQELLDKAGRMSPEEAERRLDALAAAHAGELLPLDLPEPSETPYTPPPAEAPRLACRRFAAEVDRSLRMSSFTALSSEGGHAMVPSGLDEAATPDPAPVQEPEPWSLFAFPRGARPGTALHAFMEHLDFRLAAQGRDGGETAALAAKTLAEYGYDPNFVPALVDMAQRVCNAELVPGVRLAAVGPEDKLSEMDFTMPLDPLSVDRLAEVYARHEPTLGADVVERVRSLGFTEQQGHLTGVVDLVFRTEGRWYLADWKSNHLGAECADYAPEHLRRAMVAQCYFLQYHLYAAALDAFLRRRMAGYDYAEHFGGAAYVFLRGVPGDDAPGQAGCGIYFDRPDQAFLRDLAQLLTGRAGGGEP